MRTGSAKTVELKGQRIHFRVPIYDSSNHKKYNKMSINITKLYNVISVGGSRCLLWCHGPKHDFVRTAIGSQHAFIKLLNRYRQVKYKESLPEVVGTTISAYHSVWTNGVEEAVPINFDFHSVLEVLQHPDYTTTILFKDCSSINIHGYLQEAYDGFIKTF